MKFDIAVIKGDGIGPEIIDQALKVLDAVGEKYGHTFEYTPVAVGGIAIDKYGTALPKQSLDICMESDSVLLGAVGGPKWDMLPRVERPEHALLMLRKAMGLYCNLRPAKLFPAISHCSPLKQDIIQGGLDILVIRELIGGMYYVNSGRKETDNGIAAYDTEQYSVMEIERIGRQAFEQARLRSGNLVSVDKANVMESSRLWRETMTRLSFEYPDVKFRNLFVDNCAMQAVRDPGQFDVIVASNMFGDILSDEIGMLVGSIGMLPSASIGDDKKGVYEPVHGSAPDIAGKNRANPIATILSAQMMLKYSFGLEDESRAIMRAISQVLNEGYRTADIRTNLAQEPISTAAMGTLIANRIK